MENMHDVLICLQLPEFLSLFPYYLNFEVPYLSYKTEKVKDSGRTGSWSQMTPSCKPLIVKKSINIFHVRVVRRVSPLPISA